MAKAKKTPVFFIASKAKKKPLVVNFYTQKGELVDFRSVKKVKTKAGINFFVQIPNNS